MSRLLRTYAASLVLALLSAFMALPTTSCAALGAALPSIIAAVVDGGQIIDAIEAFCAAYFGTHPDASAQAKVTEAITRCRQALNVALRTAQAAKNLTDKDIDAAFDDFKQAYLALLALVQPYGVREAKLPSGVAFRVAHGELVVPEPMVFKNLGAK